MNYLIPMTTNCKAICISYKFRLGGLKLRLTVCKGFFFLFSEGEWRQFSISPCKLPACFKPSVGDFVYQKKW